MVNLNELTSNLYSSLQSENSPRSMENWHASSIAQCPRAQFYARAAIHPLTKPTGAKILRWQAGHIIEGVIRPHLKQQFPDLISNVRFTNEELDLTGEIDNYSPEHKALIEIKSVSSHAVKYRKVADTRAHLRDERPYLGHEYQQAAYVILMRTQGTILDIEAITRNKQHIPVTLEVEQVVFLYITLDGLLVPYSMPVNEEIVSNVLKRLELLRVSWKAQEPPPCLCNENHPLWKSSTQFCDFRDGDKCCDLSIWEDQKTLVK